MPAGACDAHCHVFGPAWKFPYAADRAYTPPDAPKETLAAMHRFLDVSRAVIVQASCHDADNRATLDAIRASEGRNRGVAIVDESFDDRAFRALHDGGIRSVRFNFVRHLGSRPEPKFFQHTVARLKALVKAAPDRVLWGTDWPHPNIAKYMPNDGDLVDLVPLIAPDETQRRKLLVENPARLYGFSDAGQA